MSTILYNIYVSYCNMKNSINCYFNSNRLGTYDIMISGRQWSATMIRLAESIFTWSSRRRIIIYLVFHNNIIKAWAAHLSCMHVTTLWYSVITRLRIKKKPFGKNQDVFFIGSVHPYNVQNVHCIYFSDGGIYNT